MISKCDTSDFASIYDIINDGASAYRGIIPSDRWKEPYMAEMELREQMEAGVTFWSYRDGNKMIGVMGLQDKNEVVLIRHAYIRTSDRNKGIGSLLLQHLCSIAVKPVLIGTWADAHWAVRFYRKHGFILVGKEDKNNLLRKYWAIPDRQVETSIVLASQNWQNS